MAFFFNRSFIISGKMHGYPQFSFWIPRALAKFCYIRMVLNRAKNIPVLVGTTHRKLDNPEMRKTYAQ